MNPNEIPTPAPAPAPTQQQKSESFFGELIRFTLIALAIVIPVRLFVAQPFIVSGASMDPTFADGEYLIVNQLTYRFEDPQRGDVVIFKYPKDESKFFIKRVIGLPGEKVIIDGSEVTIVNKEHPDGFALKEPYIGSIREDSMSVTLKSDQFFVMGDNRKQSSDSRMWGTLPRKDIIGTPFVRLFPLNRVGILPGDYKQPN